MVTAEGGVWVSKIGWPDIYYYDGSRWMATKLPGDEQTLPTTTVVQDESVCPRSVNVTDLAAKLFDEDPQARQALAEYFTILRQWSLNSRPDDGLAPDSKTEEP